MKMRFMGAFEAGTGSRVGVSKARRVWSAQHVSLAQLVGRVGLKGRPRRVRHIPWCRSGGSSGTSPGWPGGLAGWQEEILRKYKQGAGRFPWGQSWPGRQWVARAAGWRRCAGDDDQPPLPFTS
ncbi:MAG: hypothetical protein ACKOJF_30595, partial [Planctomycetaceae bacterium]